METIAWILISVFVILYAINLKVFFFQRTIHKISIKYGWNKKKLVMLLLPKSYTIMYWISLIRWVVVIALFYYNWIAAIICVVGGYILSIILPEQDDYKNIQKMIIFIDKKYGKDSIPELRSALSDILKSMD